MARVRRKATRPLQINPFKLSAPMGATLAFLGVHQCLPLMHGGQGCAGFTKVFFTRHFAEPIALQTTAVTDVTAILDGGDYSISESVRNIRKKITPALIGLCTTGLTETKGDDVSGVAARLDVPLVYVNTPDYEGGLEQGWSAACSAMIRQLTRPCSRVDDNRLVLLPHVSLTPIEVEKISDLIAAFGFNVVVLPDLSSSLDGHLGEKQAALSSGGTRLEQIHDLAGAGLVISVGASMIPCAMELLKKNSLMRHHHVPHLAGLNATDQFVRLLLDETGFQTPPASVRRWRARLQDALLDCHFALGKVRVAVTGEPDMLAALCALIGEAGGTVAAVIAATDSPALDQVRAARILVGDLGDAEDLAADYDLIIGGTHVDSLAGRHGKGMLLRGFPNWEQLGNQLVFDCLYEGGAYFLCALANAAQQQHHDHRTPCNASPVA
ncbi:MAG: nitrogenase iron-molybdenum cofactor biosynthesis protein NifN [Pelovirga sp.]